VVLVRMLVLMQLRVRVWVRVRMLPFGEIGLQCWS
jgi:hypothetical protein